MSFIEQDRIETIARRRRLYGDGISYCQKTPLGSYSGVVAGRMWLGLDTEADFGSASRKAVDIVNAVLKVTLIPRNDFLSTRRIRAVTDARQLACFFMRNHTKLSYPQIAQYVGGKDHSTVIHAVNAVRQNINGKFTKRLQAIAFELWLTFPKDVR